MYVEGRAVARPVQAARDVEQGAEILREVFTARVMKATVLSVAQFAQVGNLQIITYFY